VEKRVATIDRRTQTLRSIAYGGIYPRRLDNRRPADDQHFIVDWHDSGLFMVAMAIIGMSCMDALFTLNLMSLGAEEVNYFMRVLIDTDLTSFLSVKFLATSGGVLFLVACSRFKLAGILRVRRVLEALCAVYVCLIIWELYLLVAVAKATLI
jgi:hypothetical protein